MAKLNTFPHLHFDGNCAEAFRFYAETLGGKVTFSMTVGESPMAQQMPPEAQNQIIHTRLEYGDNQALLGCDAFGGRYHKPQGINVGLMVANAEEAGRLFGALSRGGQVEMPFGPTFFSTGFGMCTDRFGIPWMVNSEQQP